MKNFTISMPKLNQLLNARLKPLGVESFFCMSGGNCGTIYLGNSDPEGFYDFAIGPSNYSTGEAYQGEFYWGRDGEGISFQYEGDDDDFNEENLAKIITNDFIRIVLRGGK